MYNYIKTVLAQAMVVSSPFLGREFGITFLEGGDPPWMVWKWGQGEKAGLFF